MNLFPFRDLPAWTMILSIGAHLSVGLFLGLFHFRTLLWNTRKFAAGGHTVANIALMVGRFILLGGALTLASFEGAVPLLITALGVLIARYAVMRQVGASAP